MLHALYINDLFNQYRITLFVADWLMTPVAGQKTVQSIQNILAYNIQFFKAFSYKKERLKYIIFFYF